MQTDTMILYLVKRSTAPRSAAERVAGEYPPLKPGGQFRYWVTSGDGSIEYPCTVKDHTKLLHYNGKAQLSKPGGHNWCGVNRIDVWFNDAEGNPWWGVHLSGGWNDIVRCRRVKPKPAPRKPKTSWTRPRYWVGHGRLGLFTDQVITCKDTPQAHNFPEFLYIVGPFKTKRGAKCFIDKPYFSIDEAERRAYNKAHGVDPSPLRRSLTDQPQP